MKSIFSLIALGAVSIGMASIASAVPSSCSSGTSDITAGGTGGFSCTIGSQTFSNFQVSETGVTGLVGLVGAGSGQVGDEDNLEFQFPNPPSTGTWDILIIYTVTGGIEGIDTNVQGNPGVTGGTVTVNELACSVAVSLTSLNCPTGPPTDLLAQYIATSTNGSDALASATFATTGTVWVKKDVSGNNATLSEFTNSQLVPEPMTLSLMGAGLLGLGLVGRKLRK